jgi:AcrR family transcriptional regulator
MNTKERILEISVQVFNTRGLRNTSTRHIATEIGISAGNLHYHFKHTEDIIQALFDRLIKESDMLMASLENYVEGVDMELVFTIFKDFYNLLTRYQFIFINFVEISLWIPSIRESYAAIVIKRKKETKRFFNLMVQKKVLRNDIPEEVWDYLINNIFIVVDFWPSHNLINEKLEGLQAYESYVSSIKALMYPYFTHPQ